ncbi:MAG TPA: hypothetical protein VGN72_21000 [Tepidisphaeraceae bacterium]|jgi:pimeloyl-ACP methyl ester carboxylesterase|nr:hypothetical protein [Tepidisphaeraceae bacterium]
MSDTNYQHGDNANARRNTGDLPTWLVALVVLLSVGGGGALVWWYFTAPPKVVTVALSEPAPRRPGGQQNRQQPQPRPEWNNDVRQTNNGFMARTGTLQMAARRRDNNPYSLVVFYRSQLMPADQLSVLRATAAVGREEQAKRLKLTPEQIESLRKVRPQRGMAMSPEDEAALRAAFEAFEKAPPEQREEPKAKLLEVLSNLEQKNLEPTKTALAANVESVRAILTPEQIQLLRRGD